MIKKVLHEIQKQHITITGWVLSFVGILFVRFLLESISSPTSTGVIPSDPFTLVHYLLFFLSLSLGTSLIIGYFTKKYAEAPKILLFGLPLLWLAPLVDIVLSHGKGYKMLYIFDTGKQIIFNFFTFFGPHLMFGATYGMRIGIALSILGIGYYIWMQNKNVWKSILGGFLIYILIFIFGSLPGVVYTLSHMNNSSVPATEVVNYFETTIKSSTIAHNTLHDGISSVTDARFLELGFNKLLSQILFILSCLFGAILFWKMDPKKFKAIIKNCRVERINFYIASLFCGIGFAYINSLGNPFVWVDAIGILCLVLSYVSLWMNAVHINDIIDVDIDTISNTQRPLIQKEVSKEDMYDTGNMWLVVALLGSWCAGFYPFFMCLVYISASYIYSSPPLRLRRFPLVPSFLISVACLGTILTGFFFISTHKEIQTFPSLLAVGILIIVTLAINFKDIKDIEGDRANGVMTLPVLFGKNGVRVVALCFALSILLIPIFLSFYFLYIFALPSAFVGYRLIIKKPYREKPIFVLRFILLACIALSYIVVYSLGHIYNI